MALKMANVEWTFLGDQSPFYSGGERLGLSFRPSGIGAMSDRVRWSGGGKGRDRLRCRRWAETAAGISNAEGERKPGG